MSTKCPKNVERMSEECRQNYPKGLRTHFWDIFGTFGRCSCVVTLSNARPLQAHKFLTLATRPGDCPLTGGVTGKNWCFCAFFFPDCGPPTHAAPSNPFCGRQQTNRISGPPNNVTYDLQRDCRGLPKVTFYFDKFWIFRGFGGSRRSTFSQPQLLWGCSLFCERRCCNLQLFFCAYQSKSSS